MNIKVLQFMVVTVIALVVFMGVLGSQHTTELLEITQRDPLFYTPDIDIPALREEVRVLSRTHETIREHGLSYLRETGSETRPSTATGIVEGFLPFGYLEELPFAIEGTQRFLEKPSFVHGIKMIFADIRTAYAYKRDAQTLLQNVETSVSERSTPIRFFYLAAESNTDVVIRDLEKIVRNGDRLIEDTWRRGTCLLFGVCRVGGEYVLSADISVPHKEVFRELPDIVVPEYLKSMSYSGPYIVESGCFPRRFTALTLYDQNELLPFYIKEVDENYYIDFTARIARNSNDVYARFFLDNGVLYDDQPEGVGYRCGDLAYWGDMSLFRYLEEEFEDTDILSMSDVAQLYKEFPDTEYKYRLAVENRLMDFPQMIEKIHKNLETQLFLESKGYIRPAGIYYLAARSEYSLLFNTFSRSVWRLSSRPEFHVQENTDVAELHTTYSALKERYSDEEIKAFNIFPDEAYYQLHERK